MSVRIEREIRRSADVAYDRFCHLDDIPDWVPIVDRVEVERRHADGLPARVLFHISPDAGQATQYRLDYDYDPVGHRVSWHPVDGHDDAVRGYVSFAERGPGHCTMTYVLEHGARRGDDRNVLEAEASRAADGFVVWMAG